MTCDDVLHIKVQDVFHAGNPNKGTRESNAYHKLPCRKSYAHLGEHEFVHTDGSSTVWY